MENNRVISALCYFSVFFAGFILPLVVLLIVKDREVKKHASHALISHLLLYIPAFIFAIGLMITGFITSDAPATESGSATLAIGVIGLIIALGVLSLAIIIWNVYRGIKVLTSKEDITYEQ